MYSITNIIITTIHVCKQQQITSATFKKFNSLLIVARIEMKLGTNTRQDNYMFLWRLHVCKQQKQGKPIVSPETC